jgi:hypothetical protein
MAQDGDLDILVVGLGTQVDQPEDASYEQEHEVRGHAGCTSWLLRPAFLYLHPSGHAGYLDRMPIVAAQSCDPVLVRFMLRPA